MFFSCLKIDLFLPIRQTPCILNQWMKDERYHLSETHWSTHESRNCLWTWIKIPYVHTTAMCHPSCLFASKLQPLHWEMGWTFRGKEHVSTFLSLPFIFYKLHCSLSSKYTTILTCKMLWQHGIIECLYKECVQPFQCCEKGRTSLFSFILNPRMAVMFFLSPEEELTTLKLCKHR